MKKLLITAILLGLFVPQSLFSQTEGEKKSSFHIGIIPLPPDKEYTHTFSFNLLAGISKNEKAFTFAGLANIICRNANGVQFAGLSNIIGNNAKGVQFSGLYNQIGNEGVGLGFAGLMNRSGNSYRGMQFAGLLNQTKSLTGLQFAGLVNLGNEVSGLQFAGLLNKSTSAQGFQFAGLGNVGEDVSGMQFGGLFNRSAAMRGFQFAGLFNKAKHVEGVQFAGLMNIADHSDYPIGLLNIIKDGEKSVGITYDEAGSVIAGLRTGGRILYGILGMGYNHEAREEEWVIQGGFGAHIPVVDRFRINCELTAQYMSKLSDSDTYINKSTFALLPAFKLASAWEIFAGPTINYMYTDNMENNCIFPGNSLWKRTTESKREQIYIGYTAGIQFIF